MMLKKYFVNSDFYEIADIYFFLSVKVNIVLPVAE